MPRPKAHTEVEFHSHVRFELLIDEYVNASPGRALPERWGYSPSSRRLNATLLAEFSCSPGLLKPYPADLSQAANSHDDHLRQVLFARLFATAPDYFLAFVSHFRRTAIPQSQVERVARTILAYGDRLLIAKNGKERPNKEIAEILEARKELRLQGLHASVVGKARKLISKWCEQEAANRSERNAESMVFTMRELEELQSMIEAQDNCLS